MGTGFYVVTVNIGVTKRPGNGQEVGYELRHTVMTVMRVHNINNQLDATVSVYS